jgi:methylmalonyl-CoA mutase, C-terminal domain
VTQDAATTPCRVVVAKLGLDGHDRGAKVVAHALQEAGLEVIYTGLRRTPEQVVAIAADEDVDVIGLSILSGAHLTLVGQVMELLRERGLDDDLPIVVGGTISTADAKQLLAMGVRDVFPVRSPLEELAPRVLRAAGR